MVLTRTMRRKAEEQYGVDNNIDAVLSALSPAAYALERPGAAVEPVSGNSKPTLLRKSSSLQAITETARLVRSESWRHIERQLELAASGEHPLDIQFSWLVAVSSLFYLAVTASYASHGNYALAALFTSISVLSLFADSVAPKNKLVNSLDRVVASLGFIFSPLWVMIAPGVASLQVRGMAWLLALIAGWVLAWSRSSADMKQYTIRHTVWHALSTIGLVWLAEVQGRGELQGPLAFHVPKFLTQLSAALF